MGISLSFKHCPKSWHYGWIMRQISINSSIPSVERMRKIWLGYMREVIANIDSREFQKQISAQRKKILDDIHVQIKKYLNRIPAEVVSQSANHSSFWLASSLFGSCLLTILALHDSLTSCRSDLSCKCHGTWDSNQDSGQDCYQVSASRSMDSSSSRKILI